MDRRSHANREEMTMTNRMTPDELKRRDAGQEQAERAKAQEAQRKQDAIASTNPLFKRSLEKTQPMTLDAPQYKPKSKTLNE